MTWDEIGAASPHNQWNERNDSPAWGSLGWGETKETARIYVTEVSWPVLEQSQISQVQKSLLNPSKHNSCERKYTDEQDHYSTPLPKLLSNGWYADSNDADQSSRSTSPRTEHLDDYHAMSSSLATLSDATFTVDEATEAALSDEGTANLHERVHERVARQRRSSHVSSSSTGSFHSAVETHDVDRQISDAVERGHHALPVRPATAQDPLTWPRQATLANASTYLRQSRDPWAERPPPPNLSHRNSPAWSSDRSSSTFSEPPYRQLRSDERSGLGQAHSPFRQQGFGEIYQVHNNRDDPHQTSSVFQPPEDSSVTCEGCGRICTSQIDLDIHIAANRMCDPTLRISRGRSPLLLVHRQATPPVASTSQLVEPAQSGSQPKSPRLPPLVRSHSPRSKHFDPNPLPEATSSAVRIDRTGPALHFDSSSKYCDRCRRHFTSHWQLEKHLVTTKFHPYFCRNCSVDFDSFGNYQMVRSISPLYDLD